LLLPVEPEIRLRFRLLVRLFPGVGRFRGVDVKRSLKESLKEIRKNKYPLYSGSYSKEDSKCRRLTPLLKMRVITPVAE
jgi:hypothetical protein